MSQTNATIGSSKDGYNFAQTLVSSGDDNVLNFGSDYETVLIEGTGSDDNLTVVMDFWEDSSALKSICVDVNPELQNCSDHASACLDDVELENYAGSNYSGAGCNNNAGPIWVSVPLVDEGEKVWAKFYQSADSEYTGGSESFA